MLYYIYITTLLTLTIIFALYFDIQERGLKNGKKTRETTNTRPKATRKRR